MSVDLSVVEAFLCGIRDDFDEFYDTWEGPFVVSGLVLPDHAVTVDLPNLGRCLRTTRIKNSVVDGHDYHWRVGEERYIYIRVDEADLYGNDYPGEVVL